MKKASLLLVCLSLALLAGAQPVPEKPVPARFVNDFAQLLGEGEEAALEQKLHTYQDTTSNQFVIVTLSSLEGYDIESYSIELASKWGIGQKGKNNGVLILVAPQERKMRIEVGYGLEGAIPDATANEIIREVMKPRFKENNYYQGLDEATTYLIKYASGEFKADPKQKRKGVSAAGIFVLVVFVLIFLSFLSKARRVRQSHLGGDLSFWTILSLLSSFGNHRRGGGGWGGGSSGGGGGSGWDFGGGSFGGGGSSGDW